MSGANYQSGLSTCAGLHLPNEQHASAVSGMNRQHSPWAIGHQGIRMRSGVFTRLPHNDHNSTMNLMQPGPLAGQQIVTTLVQISAVTAN